jgi:hypothetical protein
MTDTACELMTRKQFLQRMGISDSSERRGRRGGGEWPPHLLIGKKVYYRPESCDDWLRHREAITQSAHQRAVDCTDAEAMTAILRRAKVLADTAPPLTPQQVIELRSIFANRAGAGRP